MIASVLGVCGLVIIFLGGCAQTRYALSAIKYAPYLDIESNEKYESVEAP